MSGTPGAILEHVQTGSGKLTLTEQSVTIEGPGFPRPKARTVFRAAIVGVDHKVSAKPLFGKGGTMQLTVHVQGGETLVLRAVPWAAAHTFLAAFGLTA